MSETWKDHGFDIPASVRVSKAYIPGTDAELAQLQLGGADLGHEFSVTMPIGEVSPTSVRAAVCNLVMAAFEAKFPGRHMAMVAASCKSLSASALPTTDTMLSELAAFV